MSTSSLNLDAAAIAVVIPAYRAENSIQKVIEGIPGFIDWIVVVNDCSPDNTRAAVESCLEKRVVLVNLDVNQGVGGATLRGYQAACELGADILVKMDSDGQMDPDYLIPLLTPILQGEADYAKGNRFMYLRRIKAMPPVRRIGNLGLSFLNKLASGYWNIFDPTNGYTAITKDIFSRLDLESIHRRYFFESSMLIELNLQRAVVKDVYIPACYADEESSLSELDSLLRFPYLLLKGALKRIFIQYFIRDFSAFTLFFCLGNLLAAWGVGFGLLKWFESSQTGIPTKTGTLMLAVIPFILGVQFLLQAILMDIQNVPTYKRSRD